MTLGLSPEYRTVLLNPELLGCMLKIPSRGHGTFIDEAKCAEIYLGAIENCLALFYSICFQNIIATQKAGI